MITVNNLHETKAERMCRLREQIEEMIDYGDMTVDEMYEFMSRILNSTYDGVDPIGQFERPLETESIITWRDLR